MTVGSAIWTLTAWLFAAAGIGFAAAWLIQYWRMVEGRARAAELSSEHAALQSALALARGSPATGTRDDGAAEVARVQELRRQMAPLKAERDALIAEREALLAERDALASDRDALASRSDALASDCDALALERDALAAERHAVATQRDAALAESDAALAQREAGPRESELLRSQVGSGGERVRELEQAVNRLQLEALVREQAHQSALLAAEARHAVRSEPESAPQSDDDAEVAQRIAAQRLQELEDGLARARRLAREHRAEVIGLKGRIQDLESRLTQLWAHQAAATAADTPSSAERHPA